ncbi:MAG: nSTAND1 domain-containing NTPase [Burkholderiales bacterium]
MSAVSAKLREHEVRLLADLVRLSRVTLLVAEAGSGKSEVVRSGVMPLLQGERRGEAKEVAVLLDWWKRLPLAVLNARIDEALERIVGPAAHAIGDHASAATLTERLAARQQAFDCSFIIIFDGFEEFLAAPADRPDAQDFEAQFIEAVNSRTLRANFLLSLDEDAAPLLARMNERIPGLGDAQVRLPKISAAYVAPSASEAASSDELVGSRAVVQTNEGDAQITGEYEAPIPSAGEAVSSITDFVRERHDLVGSTPGTVERSDTAAHPADAPSRSVSKRAAIMVAMAVVVVSSLVVLGTRKGTEHALVPDAAAPSRSTAPVPRNAKPASDEQAQRGSPAAPQQQTQLQSGSVASPPNAGTLTPDAVRKSEAAQAAAADTPVTSAPPSLEARTQENRAAAAANEPPAPLLYIIVRTEAQRAYAERMIAPLARHGIRVSGIRVASAGPPVSDLRYFRSADRAEALRIRRALDVVGTAPQRVEHAGREEQARQRQYELWLPPTD